MRALTTLMLLSLLLAYPAWCTAAPANPANGAFMPWLFLLLDEATEPVTFTFTFTAIAGQFDTLPAGATGVRVTCNGQTLSGTASPLTFTVRWM